MKRSLSVLLCLILLVLAVSCARIPFERGETMETETTEEKREPIVELSCLNEKGEIVSVSPAGEGRAVALVYHGEAEGMDAVRDAELFLIDLKEDKILKSASLSGSYLTLLCVRSNGEVVLNDYSGSRLVIYSADLSSSRTVEDLSVGSRSVYVPEEDALYACFYDGEDGLERFCRFSFDGEKAVLYVLPRGSYFEGFDPKKGLIVLSAAHENNLTGRAFFVYSLEEEDVVFSDIEEYSSFAFTSAGLLQFYTRTEGETEEEQEHFAEAWIYDTDTWEKGPAFETPDVYYQADPAHPLAFAVDPVYNYYSGEDTGTGLLYAVDFAEGRMLPFGNPNGLVASGGFSYLSGRDGLLIYTVTRQTEQEDGKSALFWIDPGQMELDRQLPEGRYPEFDAPEHTLGEWLLPARQKADAMEEKYHVHIVLGDECLDAYDASGFSIRSYEAGPFGDGTAKALSELMERLIDLDTFLSSYPAGFFERFITPLSGGGIRIMIVSELISDDLDNFVAAAVEYSSGVWYNLVIGIEDLSYDTFHHEMWHAVEDLLDNVRGEMISDEEWGALNPPGFSYHNDFDTYWDSDLYKYVLYNSGDPYFARIYSVVNAKEDRATLVEQIFDADAHTAPSVLEHLEWLKEKPHLKAKIDYLSGLLRETFGFVYWETMK